MDSQNRQARASAQGRLRATIARLEARISRQRELLWQPRLQLALAREIAHGRRHLDALRRRRY